MKKKTVSGILFALLLVGMLFASFEIIDASASPAVRIYVDMPPQGYIPGIPVGETLKVTVNIESPLEWKNTADGIIAWVLCVYVDPDVLEPITVKSASSGYFLHNFAKEHGRWTAILFVTDKEAGLFKDIVEAIMGYLEVGAGGDGKLCELWFKSKSQTAYTLVDLYFALYRTRSGGWFPVDMVEDGHYNALTANIDIDPDALNLHSKGQWITAYLQLPEGHNPEDMDATTILLSETIPPVLDPKYDFVTNSSEYIVDHDGDGILERMVKFNRTEVASWVFDDLGIQYGDVVLSITGELVDGTPFEGTVVIRVLFPGDVDGDGYVGSADAGMFSGAYGTSIGNPLYVPEADFDEDGYIGSADAGILSGNYGKTAV